MDNGAHAVETAVWKKAFDQYTTAALRSIIRDACQTRPRERGDPGRLHASEVTAPAVAMVWSVMTDIGLVSPLPSNPPSYIPIRSTLRAHITRELQKMLVRDGNADGPIVDQLFSSDLGL